MNTKIANLIDNKFFIDMHTHSHNSFDAETTFEDCIKTSKEKNIKVVAITDHCDLSSDNSNILQQVKESFDETARYANESTDVLLLKGIEIGQGIQYKDLYDEIITTFDFDFILMSTHQLFEKEDFYFINYDDVDPLPLLKEYFDEILISTQTLDFDSLAHLTYPLRYINGNYKKGVSLETFNEVIDEILKSLIKRGKCLEINTGGVRKPVNEISPEYDIIERYYALGGRLLTVGSDSHYANHLAADLFDCMKRLKQIGFSEICYYVNRQLHTATL